MSQPYVSFWVLEVDMAGRIRSIKPELIEDAVTAGLSDGAFRLFIGLILMADDYGSCRADPELLHGHVFWKRRRPCNGAEVAELLFELQEAGKEDGGEGLIQLYQVRGQTYARLLGWEKHQKVHHPGKPRMPLQTDAKAELIQPVVPILGRVSGESRESLPTDQRPATSDQIYSRSVGRSVEPLQLESPAPPARVLDLDLEEAYAPYPRKDGGKSPGMAKLRRTVKTPETLAQLKLAVKHYTQLVTGRERQYVMLWKTFSNCWQDYVDPNVLAAGSSSPVSAPRVPSLPAPPPPVADRVSHAEAMALVARVTGKVTASS